MDGEPPPNSATATCDQRSATVHSPSRCAIGSRQRLCDSIRCLARHIASTRQIFRGRCRAPEDSSPPLSPAGRGRASRGALRCTGRGCRIWSSAASPWKGTFSRGRIGGTICSDGGDGGRRRRRCGRTLAWASKGYSGGAGETGVRSCFFLLLRGGSG